MASKNIARPDPICIYEQESEVFLRLAGILEGNTGSTGITGDAEIQIITINKSILAFADGGILVIRAPSATGGQEFRFSSSVVVLSPDIRPCPRKNSCKQVVRYIEIPAYIDISPVETRQLQVCTLIVASGGLVYLFENACDCAEDLRGAPRAIAGVDSIDFPSAESFLIHLKFVCAAPAAPVAPPGIRRF